MAVYDLQHYISGLIFGRAGHENNEMRDDLLYLKSSISWSIKMPFSDDLPSCTIFRPKHWSYGTSDYGSVLSRAVE